MLDCIVDLSNNNGVVDLKKAAANGIQAVIHKATEGLHFVDKSYTVNKQKAHEAGLLWGAYHFGTGSDPIAQAQHFLETVKPGAGELLALDFERDLKEDSMTLDQAKAFVSYIHDKTGRWPGLYSSNWVKEKLGARKDAVLANCWLWLAQYGPTPVVPVNWATWTLWQYTDGQSHSQSIHIDGIGFCDRDKFNGDLNSFRQFWGAAASQDNVKIIAAGKQITGRLINDTSYVPVREFCAAFGKDVQWDAAQQVVMIPPVTTAVPQESPPGVRVAIGAIIFSAIMIDDHVFAPVRELAKALGHSVTWDQTAMTATVQ